VAWIWVCLCPPSSDRLEFIHDIPYGFILLPSAIYPRGYCQQNLRWLSYHHSFRYYTVTRVDRASVGFPLMVGSRGISWGTEWNLAELGQGRGRRSSLHEPTNRPRVPLSYSFYGYEQSSRDDPPWVWCVSEVEILVLVAPGESCGKQRNYKLTNVSVRMIRKEAVHTEGGIDSLLLVTVIPSVTIPSCWYKDQWCQDTL
jgi:hypothetical protein